jgi:hypothetical protein
MSSDDFDDLSPAAKALLITFIAVPLLVLFSAFLIYSALWMVLKIIELL